MTIQEIEERKRELRLLWIEGKRDRTVLQMQARLLDMAKEKLVKKMSLQQALEWEASADKTGYDV